MDINSRLKEISQQAGSQNGCRLYDFYPHRDRFQIFIDKKDQSVSLKDCENVFHSLKFLIRSEFPDILEQKRLEVSSPGLDKKLREMWHFEEAIGKSIQIITLSPVQSVEQEGVKTASSQAIRGELVSVDTDHILIKQPKREWLVPCEKIKSAALLSEIQENKTSNKQQRGR